MFRTVPLSIIRSFSLCTQQWYTYVLTACEQDQDGTSWYCSQAVSAYTISVCTVKNSLWWTEELYETCRVLFQKQIWEISVSSWFYYKNLSRCTVTLTSNTWICISFSRKLLLWIRCFCASLGLSRIKRVWKTSGRLASNDVHRSVIIFVQHVNELFMWFIFK